MSSVLLICELCMGMGHLSRTSRLAEAMVSRFRVLLLLITDLPVALKAPDGVELRILSYAEAEAAANRWPIESPLHTLAHEFQPDVIGIEYFPFGRRNSKVMYLAFLMQLHRIRSPRPLLFCSVRDIQDGLSVEDRDFTVKTLNRWFDHLLIHSDERISRLEHSFRGADAIKIPIVYTHYVARPFAPLPEAPVRGKTIVVSCGGGLAAGNLLWCAIEAAKRGLLPGYTLRLFAGNLLDEKEWTSLQKECAGAEDIIELHRWASDLRLELLTAAASVSQFGYNTALEVLSSGVPALIVPYTSEGEPEQLDRARAWAEHGAVRVLPKEQLTTDTLAEEIQKTLHFIPSKVEVRMDGAERTCALLWEWVTNRRESAGL